MSAKRNLFEICGALPDEAIAPYPNAQLKLKQGIRVFVFPHPPGAFYSVPSRFSYAAKAEP